MKNSSQPTQELWLQDLQQSRRTVYAGSVFNLTVNVKNTSTETTVKNVLFDLQATVEGSTTVASYSAFLPTSGSSSVYTDAIAPGETYQMSIEMEAKSDLAQKPYVLTVNMKYDTDEEINKTDTASVSIPVKQEAKDGQQVQQKSCRNPLR